MPKKVTISFSRDQYQGAACLEYSWVPEGKRRVIQLLPGHRSGKQTDSVADDLQPSHVQVYTLNNDDRVGLKMWQFPTVAGSEIADASINVLEAQLRAIGEVMYTDGTLGPPSFATLYEGPVQCPDTSPGTRLIAPWFKLWNEIRYSIGEDPNVQIDPLSTNSSPYLISIHVSDSTKASALASILLPTHSFGEVTVNVQVDSSGTVVQSSALTTNQDVNRAVNRALATNTLFLGAFPTPNGRIGVLFARAIVQFFNDDSTELYLNFNAPAAAVFKDVLTLSYGRVSLLLGTQMPGLIQQLGAQSE